MGDKPERQVPAGGITPYGDGGGGAVERVENVVKGFGCLTQLGRVGAVRGKGVGGHEDGEGRLSFGDEGCENWVGGIGREGVASACFGGGSGQSVY